MSGVFRRTLPAGSVLWWQGDKASSIAVVEKGCMGVRAEGRLLDVAIPGTVLGEAAVLSLDGATGVRTADVIALQADTEVVEYSVDALSDADPNVPATVLKTLFYQTARNVLLVRAAQGGGSLVGESSATLARAAAAAYRQAGNVRGWVDFLTTFRFAYRWREFSDALCAELAPPGRWTPAAVRTEVAGVLDGDLASAVEGFVDLWSAMSTRRVD